MGYRSEFKLLLVGDKPNLEKVIEYVEDMYTRPANELAGTDEAEDVDDGFYSLRSWSELFCEDYAWQPEDPGTPGVCAIVWAEESCKCYGKFDAFIDRVMSYADDMKCDSAFARVGESPEDVDSKTNGPSGRAYVPVIRYIGEPAW